MSIDNYFISKDELLTLLFHLDDNKISTHSLSTWIKSKTEDKFVVVPRGFCVLMVSFLEKQAAQKENLLFDCKKVFEQIEEVKRYL